MGPPPGSPPRAEINIEPAGKSGCPGSLLCGIGHPGGAPESILSARFTIYSQYERLLRKSPVGACIFKLSIKLQLEELAEKCHLLRYRNASSFGPGCHGI